MTVPPLDRKLLAILAADLVGYSKAMEADEAGTIARLKAVRAELTDPSISRHRGRIVKLMGDGALVAFDSIVDAVTCAAEIQRAVAVRNAGLPVSERMVFRIGVNLGDVALVDDDVYGDGVNIAARLEQLAEPGGVMVSGTAFDHLQGKLDCPLDFVGEQQVKNIARPVRAYRIRLDGKRARQPLLRSMPRWAIPAVAALGLLAILVGVWQFSPTATVGGKPSVAVLPFDNYGGDEATGRLADGLTEDIITDLAGFPEFQVIARNSTEQYRDKPAVPSEVAKALGAGFVVEGSIQRQSDRVRITAQLIDAKTGKHLWSQRWDRPDEDLFAIQIEISEQISNRLGGGAGLVQEAGRITAHRKPPENLTAYELYLLGTEKLEQVNQADVEEAVRLLTRAVELDPGLARAWVELSHSHGILFGFGVEPDKNRALSAEAAERAVQLDPSDAEAHAVYAMTIGDRGEFERAKAEFDTALRLAPGHFEVLTFYSDWASTFGEPERGAELVDKAVSLNPGFPMWSARIFTHAYFMVGRYEDALRMLNRLTPENYGRKHWVMRSGALATLGRTEEAKVSVTDALRRFPNLTVEGFVNQPWFNEAERQRLIETMQLAGFPDCAKAEELAKTEKPLRLPECASH